MDTYAEKPLENKSKTVSENRAKQQNSNTLSIQFDDNRSEIIAQAKMQEAANDSPQSYQLKTIQDFANSKKDVSNTIVQRVPIGIEDLDTENIDEIWDYFNTIEDEENFTLLITALNKLKGLEELISELKTAWEAYISGGDEHDNEDDNGDPDGDDDGGDGDDPYDDNNDYDEGDDIDDIAAEYEDQFDSIHSGKRGKRKHKKPPFDKQRAVRKAQIKKNRTNSSASKAAEVSAEDILDNEGEAVETLYDGERGRAAGKPKLPPAYLKGLTLQEIDGLEIVGTIFTAARVETYFYLTSKEKRVSKQMLVHLSIQRHYYETMDTGEAKELNSLMRPAIISREDIETDMEEVTEKVAGLWKSKPSAVPSVLKTKVSSGRTYDVDGLTIGGAHAYVTGGPGVVSVSRDEFIALKAIKDAENDGSENEARGIINRHLTDIQARKKLYQMAVNLFGISKATIEKIEAKGLKGPGKSGGKQKGGNWKRN